MSLQDETQISTGEFAFRKHLVSLAKVLVSVGALTYLFNKHPLSWSDFTEVDHFYLAFALILLVGQVLVNSSRWRSILSHFGSQSSLPTVIAVYWASVFFNQVLPSVGGDVVRVLYHRRLGLPAGLLTVSVILDRGVALAALLIIGLVAIPMLRAIDGAGALLQSLAVTIVSLLALGYGIAMLQPAVAKTRMWGRLPLAIQTLFESIRWALLSPRALFLLLPISLSVHIASVGAIYLIALAIEAPLTFATALALGPILLIAQMIPLSIGGWGIRESAAIVLFGLAGVSEASSFRLSVIFGLAALIASLPGVLSGLLLRGSVSARTPSGNRQEGTPRRRRDE